MNATNMYGLIEEGVVVEGPRVMFGSWRNVTNLECYSVQELAAFGWFPVWTVPAVAGPGQELGGVLLTFDEGNGRVLMTNEVVDLSDAAFNADIDRQIAAADVERDQALTTGVLYGGKRWHCDIVFSTHILGMIAAYTEGLVAANSKQPVRTLDNEIMLLSRAEIAMLGGAVMARQQQIFGQSWTIKDALRAQRRVTP